ncbi:hypothetical protein C8J57DRAFT_639114 [Mycena rebaudengoi]|nr:hypothetical protein C8J57DRAFT_639114 [Mycena rebaudengoi]
MRVVCASIYMMLNGVPVEWRKRERRPGWNGLYDNNREGRMDGSMQARGESERGVRWDGIEDGMSSTLPRSQEASTTPRARRPARGRETANADWERGFGCVGDGVCVYEVGDGGDGWHGMCIGSHVRIAGGKDLPLDARASPAPLERGPRMHTGLRLRFGAGATGREGARATSAWGRACAYGCDCAGRTCSGACAASRSFDSRSGLRSRASNKSLGR